jgi:hypothetical protein
MFRYYLLVDRTKFGCVIEKFADPRVPTPSDGDVVEPVALIEDPEHLPPEAEHLGHIVYVTDELYTGTVQQATASATAKGTPVVFSVTGALNDLFLAM